MRGTRLGVEVTTYPQSVPDNTIPIRRCDTMSFTCYTIGGNSLCIACSELLIESGHDVLGVITTSNQVIQWAESRGLRVIDADHEYAAALEEQPFDFLFSIAHLAMIPQNVLHLPRRAAINFHDGVLPQYAGLNVPAWAILQREATHGVTWHLMTEQADAGDILKQATFDIAPRESALTLNAKCFDAGIKTFGELVDELDNDSAQRQTQDLSRRTYFRREDRPAAACFLDWRCAAVELDARVRATHFGNYFNPFGTTKIRVDSRVYLVSQAHSLSTNTTAAPGTVIAADDDQLLVATAQGVLAIDNVAELDGRAVGIQEFCTRHAISEGFRLDSLTDEDVDRISELDRRMAKAEPFWTQRLVQMQAVTLLGSADETTSSDENEILTIPIPTAFLERFKNHLGDALAAAFAALTAIATVSSRVDLAVQLDDSDLPPDSKDDWISRRLPIHIDLNTSQSFVDVLDHWHTQRDTASRRPSWLRDLVGRTPELRGRQELRGGWLDSTGIHFVSTLKDRAEISHWASLVLVIPRHEATFGLSYGRGRFSIESVETMSRRFVAFLERIASAPDLPLKDMSILTSDEELLLCDWNQTALPYAHDACIHHLFEQQVKRTPAATAITFAGNSLTYDELNRRANQLAAHLRALGTRPDQLVGVCLDRSLEMVITILAIHKAGAAYVPLDPAFPPQRIALMLRDSSVPLVVTHAHLAADLATFDVPLLQIDGDWQTTATYPDDNPVTDVASHNLAYVIYTSGSTGVPKGVMVEHRNVVNFFAGMDQRISVNPDGQQVLLAVTSLSFDISVLELLWTLTRGFKVVIYSERHRATRPSTASTNTRPMQFGLFFFSSDESEREDDTYRLLTEATRFADENGFVSVSTPERHFHAFGGLYPNPAVTGAALAAITKNVQIRAGSVVLPLHHPIRVAEDWSVLDNLSHGRVGISFASGWQPVDFVLRPEAYRERHRILYESIETVRRLWRGESVEFADANGEARAICTLPRPVQKELPVWVTTAGSADTWINAGKIGANVLTHLLGQTVDEIREKIQVYRSAYRQSGHSGQGNVVLMLHAFVGKDMDSVRRTVRGPMTEYLASSLSLVKNVASAWSAFKRKADGTVGDCPSDLNDLTRSEMQDLLEFSFERYFTTSSLFGTPEHCARHCTSLAWYRRR